MIIRKRKKILLFISWLLVVMAITALAIGVFVAWSQNQTADGPSQVVQRGNRDIPDTKRPSNDAFANYKVAAQLPRYIFIPTLSVKAIVRHLSTTKDNKIASPGNVFETGWYNKSAQPGQPGAMLIDGHVSAPTAHGVFYDLKKLTPGDTIKVERGDGKTFTYEVVRSQTYEANNVDMAAVLSPVAPDTPGLNLITCTGNVIEGTDDFDKRIVVFAKQSL